MPSPAPSPAPAPAPAAGLALSISLALTISAAGCGDGDGWGGGQAWEGSVDTLASGQVVVRNTERGLWAPDEAWRIVEELRIGAVDGTGPEAFGRISTFEVDPEGRIWVLDDQAQELRVFGRDGAHVRTVGRQGGGPEEFQQAVRVELGPDGNLWVMDPQNNRLSVIDTAGAFVDSHRALGGFIIRPWPGRFDDEGHYYSPAPLPGGELFRMGLLRTDLSFGDADTLHVPTDPVERESFDHTTAGGGFIRASVPFQGGLRWRLTPRGTFLAMVTDEYRIFELDRSGDTLRTVTRAFTPLPVTAPDRERAQEIMEWFTNQGGRWDPSRLPRTKPATRDFHLDDRGHLWVALVTEDDTNRLWDVFDPEGRYLGEVELPFALSSAPLVRGDELYGVVLDELEVPYLVRARIERP